MPQHSVWLVSRLRVSLSLPLGHACGPNRAPYRTGPDDASLLGKLNPDRVTTNLVYDHPKRVAVGLFCWPLVLQPEFLWVQ